VWALREERAPFKSEEACTVCIDVRKLTGFCDRGIKKRERGRRSAWERCLRTEATTYQLLSILVTEESRQPSSFHMGLRRDCLGPRYIGKIRATAAERREERCSMAGKSTIPWLLAPTDDTCGSRAGARRRDETANPWQRVGQMYSAHSQGCRKISSGIKRHFWAVQALWRRKHTTRILLPVCSLGATDVVSERRTNSR
jgi:hypothetical protein